MAIVRFAVVATSVRILLSEQPYGAVGLLTSLGMGNDQLIPLYIVVSLATVAARRFADLTRDRSGVAVATISPAAAAAVGAGWEIVETAAAPTDDA